MRCVLRLALTVLLLFAAKPAAAQESTCLGTVAKGKLENGVSLPASGPNFSAYSSLGVSLGRTYVHSKVRDIVVAAYDAMAKAAPDKVFVYGETGWASGGRIRPHRTHENGTSVDFFVPVLDATGHSVPLPTGATNRFGYGLEFDGEGRIPGYVIDFAAIAEHLFQLHQAATARGAGLALVIFDPPYLPKLFATPRGEFLRQNLKFMKGKAWVRHDDHYHVDFAIPCRPLE